MLLVKYFYVSQQFSLNVLFQFSRSVVCDSLWSHGLQHSSLPYTWPSPGACSVSCLLCLWWHPTISSSVVPFSSCPQSISASGSFPVIRFFASGGQSIGASALVLPKNIQGWFPVGLTGLISLLSKRLLRVSSSTTIWKHQFFSAQPSLWSNSHNHTWPLEKPWLWLYRLLLAKCRLCFLILRLGLS